MTQLTLATPVPWPINRPKTPASKRSTLPGVAGNLTYGEAVVALREELRPCAYDNAVLYTGYADVENDRLRKKVDATQGVALMLALDDHEYLLPCDAWSLTQQNIYALYLTLHHLHQAEKWGAASMQSLLCDFSLRISRTVSHGPENGDAAFWQDVLGLGPSARLTDANATYRARAKEMAHDEASLMKLNQAIEEARKVLR